MNTKYPVLPHCIIMLLIVLYPLTTCGQTTPECNVKINKRSDGRIGKYTSPLLVGQNQYCQIGLSVSSDGLGIFLNAGIRFTEEAQKATGSFLIQLSINNSLILPLIKSELAIINGETVSLNVYELSADDINNIKVGRLKTISFQQQDGVFQVIQVSMNEDVLKRQLACLENTSFEEINKPSSHQQTVDSNYQPDAHLPPSEDEENQPAMYISNENNFQIEIPVGFVKKEKIKEKNVDLSVYDEIGNSITVVVKNIPPGASVSVENMAQKSKGDLESSLSEYFSDPKVEKIGLTYLDSERAIFYTYSILNTTTQGRLSNITYSIVKENKIYTISAVCDDELRENYEAVFFLTIQSFHFLNLNIIPKDDVIPKSDTDFLFGEEPNSRTQNNSHISHNTAYHDNGTILFIAFILIVGVMAFFLIRKYNSDIDNYSPAKEDKSSSFRSLTINKSIDTKSTSSNKHKTTFVEWLIILFVIIIYFLVCYYSLKHDTRDIYPYRR